MLFFAKNAPLYDYSLVFPDHATLESIIDKSHLMRFAEMHKIPVPKTFYIDDPDDLQKIVDGLTYPVMIKPNPGGEEGGVSYGLTVLIWQRKYMRIFCISRFFNDSGIYPFYQALFPMLY